jgi:hypothetical protein
MCALLCCYDALSVVSPFLCQTSKTQRDLIRALGSSKILCK